MKFRYQQCPEIPTFGRNDFILSAVQINIGRYDLQKLEYRVAVTVRFTTPGMRMHDTPLRTLMNVGKEVC